MPSAEGARWHSTQSRARGVVAWGWWWIIVIPERPAAVTGISWSRRSVPSAAWTVAMVLKPTM